MCVCFFQQKTVYEIRIMDWSSDQCFSDLESAGHILAERIVPRVVEGEREGRSVEREAVRPQPSFRIEHAQPHLLFAPDLDQQRFLPNSEGRRLGKECAVMCRSRGRPYH